VPVLALTRPWHSYNYTSYPPTSSQATKARAYGAIGSLVCLFTQRLGSAAACWSSTHSSLHSTLVWWSGLPFPCPACFQSSELSWRSICFRFVFLVSCGHGWKAAASCKPCMPKSHSTLARPQRPLASSLSLRHDTTRPVADCCRDLCSGAARIKA
jgi:hypothetical protein